MDENYNYSIFSNMYVREIHDTIMEFCCPRETILDFGCHTKQIKERYPEYNVLCYDKEEKYTELKDYWNTKPDVIICSHVLEHIPFNELLYHLGNFRNMKPRLLIIASPRENWLSNLMVFLLRSKAHESHVHNYKEINRIIGENGFKLIKKYNLFTMTEVCIWKIE